MTMSKMIQIRHVPDDVHRKLKARAALAGMSLSEYLLAEARRALERPTRVEILERIARRASVNPRVPAAEIVRGERDRR
jgi:plasmid stability protein